MSILNFIEPGTVLRFDKEKGFGFMRRANRSRVFFHVNSYRLPEPSNDEVDYEPDMVRAKLPREPKEGDVLAFWVESGRTVPEGRPEPAFEWTFAIDWNRAVIAPAADVARCALADELRLPPNITWDGIRARISDWAGCGGLDVDEQNRMLSEVAKYV